MSDCKTCAELNSRNHRSDSATLIIATRPMERVNLDFKEPLPSSSCNTYLLIVTDEYSRFPFACSCKDMTATTVMRCLDKLLALYGTARFLYSDNEQAFVSGDFKKYRRALRQAPIVFTIRLEMARLRNSWHCMDSSAVSIEKPWATLVVLGSCFGGCAAFCAFVIMHCCNYYPSRTFFSLPEQIWFEWIPAVMVD